MVKLKTCAFIGLGVMGYPMAGHLAAKGYKMKIYNRTQAKAKKWSREHKGMVVNSPAKAATDTDFVFTCVGNDDDIRSVLLEEKWSLFLYESWIDPHRSYNYLS